MRSTYPCEKRRDGASGPGKVRSRTLKIEGCGTRTINKPKSNPCLPACRQAGEQAGMAGRAEAARRLLFEDFFHLAEFALNFAADFFDLAFGFEAGLVEHAADFLFHGAFGFVECAFGFVTCASIHAVPRFVGAICDWCVVLMAKMAA
jgi:hypothetical protein